MAEDRTTSRRRLLRLGCAAGAAALSGCAGSIPGIETESAGGGSGNAVTGWAWENNADALEATLEPYHQQAGDGPEVAIQRVDHSAMTERFRPALVDGSGAPAFAVLESVVAPTFVRTGGLADLSDRISEEVRAQFVPAALEPITDDDGGVYALPWDVGPVAMFYRRDLYDQAGIDQTAIETWDDFVAEGEKLGEGVDMINLPPNDLDGVWRRQLQQLGGSPFTDDGKVNVHREASLQVARTIEDMVDATIANTLQSWGSEWFDAYENGTIATLPAGPWMESVLRESMSDTGGKWGVYRLPAHEAGGTRAANWGGSSLCLPSQTPDRAFSRALDYVEWTTTAPEMQTTLYRKFGLFPALSTAYEADYFGTSLSFFGDQAIRQVFADVAREMPGYDYSVDTPAVSRAMNTFLGQVVDREMSADEAVTEAAKQIADQTGREMA